MPNEQVLQTFAVVILVALALGGRLIRSLMVHQQKMTQILQESRTNPVASEQVLRELAELRNLILHQSVAIDNLRAEKSLPPPVDSVQNRLNV